MTADDGVAQVRVVITCDEVDRATLDEFQYQLQGGLQQYEGDTDGRGSEGIDLVVDLTAVRFLDSSGIRVLLEADLTARSQGRRLRVVGAAGVVQRCLEITGLAARLVEPHPSSPPELRTR